MEEERMTAEEIRSRTITMATLVVLGALLYGALCMMMVF